MNACAHDSRCGGYGGWWAATLDGGAIGWSIDPEDEYDHIGYAICGCMKNPDRNEPSSA